jgi:hypothetical protein
MDIHAAAALLNRVKLVVRTDGAEPAGSFKLRDINLIS